jgi:N-methylhydantoinase A
VTISAALARDAMQRIAEPLGVTIERAAEALIHTADATMARALRRVSVERGIDPRGVALIAFGGGGPLHACGLAERLGMTRIVIPPHAGVLSAVGLALAPERREGLLSLVASTREIQAESLALRLRGEALRLRGADGEALTPRWWARTRFIGQGYELDVPVAPGDDGATIAARFIERHQARTGFVLDREVECISVRTALLGDAWPVVFARPARQALAAEPPIDEDDGAALVRTLHGPAIVRLPDATMRVTQGWTARALAIGGWMLERS